jgi:hypothetical protein
MGSPDHKPDAAHTSDGIGGHRSQALNVGAQMQPPRIDRPIDGSLPLDIRRLRIRRGVDVRGAQQYSGNSSDRFVHDSPPVGVEIAPFMWTVSREPLISRLQRLAIGFLKTLDRADGMLSLDVVSPS